ncbi:MAG: LPS export ABC transporter periplasmic protein LptC [Phycisphaerales bacterium]|nr:LPS export ABC transporter periplasmic protein LptC [Phycisphaerales bacterium]
MVRHLVLGVSSVAVVVLLYLGYNAMLGEPQVIPDRQDLVATLPEAGGAEGEAIQVRGATIPGGGGVVYRRFDPRTGRVDEILECVDWQAVPGERNQIQLTRPELSMLLGSGMEVKVTAATGRIIGDRADEQMRPRNGVLEGGVRLVIDTARGAERTPAAERPDDLITITMETLQFDLEGGDLQTEARVVLDSKQVRIVGTGLHLVWNEDDNRIDALTIRQGEEFILRGGDLLGLTGGRERAEKSTPGEPATVRLDTRRRPERPSTAYVCTLEGGIVAKQVRGGVEVGGLDAERLEILFDVGSGPDRLLGRDEATPGLGMPHSTTAQAPTTLPVATPAESEPGAPAAPLAARTEQQELVLKWSGPLRMVPIPGRPEGGTMRRRFTASAAPGGVVRLAQRASSALCSSVTYHEDTERVWLRPTPAGRVEFTLGDGVTAAAQSVYLERATGLIKLVGDVELRSERGLKGQARTARIVCALWAELRLVKQDAAVAVPEDAELLGTQRIESARFVGTVSIETGGQKLMSDELTVVFRPGMDGLGFEQALESAFAFGNVHLASADGRLTCLSLALDFAVSPAGEVFPTAMDAFGRVQIARGAAQVNGQRVLTTMGPPLQGAARGGFVLRELRVLGAAELLDPENKVAARGETLTATFRGENELQAATVLGTSTVSALVYSEPYTVRGELIALDGVDQVLSVDGPSRLSFRSERGLQGERRSGTQRVVVTAQESLRIDGRQNLIRFAGDVVAVSGGETLRGKTLSLLLEDVEEATPVATQPQQPQNLSEVWQTLARALERSPGRSGDEPLSFTTGDGRRTRKELVRMRADAAVVESVTTEAGRPLPVMEASIRAPLLDLDVVNRVIVTEGLTQLLMLDRRAGVTSPQAGTTAREVVGVPAALISDGPSQTAMQCYGRMTYTLGPEGPERRDTVVFEDQVLFVHRTGREMIELGTMLPAVVEQPEVLDKIDSRSVTLECDRLEVWFHTQERANGGVPAAGGLTGAPLRLVALNADGNVYLRDVQDPTVREVNAMQIEFDRPTNQITVLGPPESEARIIVEDRALARFQVHSGQKLVLNLADGTIRSDRIGGEVRQ